ncbi:MAG: hypothetical protein GY716_02895 [bacterium]|nr:hypothetical protein [bacterium]
MTGRLALLLLICGTSLPVHAAWVPVGLEQFGQPAQYVDGDRVGAGGWLTVSIRNAGSITAASGHAVFETVDYEDSALLRVTESLPDEYVLRARIGLVDFDVANYEPDDYADPDFKYNQLGGETWVENGFYWLTLTDRLVEPDSGEDWWHRYRKIVLDSDDHTDGTTHTVRPFYMVYMNPDLDRTVGDWTSGVPHLLRTWAAGRWHTSTWNWETAFQYDDAAWYVVELEKSAGQITLRAFDAASTPIELTHPVALDLVYAMGAPATAPEFAWIGDPHVDSYEGRAEIDWIELWFNDAIDSDLDGVHDAFDNCAVASNAGQGDVDLDGEGDRCDADDGAIFNYFDSAGELSWHAEATEASWNVYGGDLALLRTTGVYTQSGPGAIRECGLAAAALTVDAPAPGEARFYLTSGVSSGVEGGLGSDGDGTPRIVTLPCP